MRAKYLTITVIFCLVFITINKASGQSKLNKYKLNTCLKGRGFIARKIGLPSTNSKMNLLELRIWRLSGYDGSARILSISLSRDSVWTFSRVDVSQLFSPKFRIDSSIKFNQPVNWKTIWPQLISLNILTLPDQSKAIKNWRMSKDIIHVVADGCCYVVEIFSKKISRAYNYSNPGDLIEDFDLNNKELKNINQIIKILDSQFDLIPGE